MSVDSDARAGMQTVDAMAAPATTADPVTALSIMIGDTTGRAIPTPGIATSSVGATKSVPKPACSGCNGSLRAADPWV